MRVTIRRATVGDEALLAELCNVVQRLHVDERPDYFKPAEMTELMTWHGNLLQQPAARVWLAEADGSAIGYLLAIFQQREATLFTRQVRWCQIDQLAVDEAHRRLGVGRALVERAIADARAEGVAQIEATCWSFNAAAQEMFRQIGFSPRIVRLELAPTNET